MFWSLEMKISSCGIDITPESFTSPYSNYCNSCTSQHLPTKRLSRCTTIHKTSARVEVFPPPLHPEVGERPHAEGVPPEVEIPDADAVPIQDNTEVTFYTDREILLQNILTIYYESQDKK